MASDSQDKTLPASPRKLAKAREDGQVARSRDLGHLLVVAGGGALLVALAPQALGWMRDLLASGLRFNADVLTSTKSMGEHLSALSLRWMLSVVPLGAVIALAAVLGSVAVGGWNWTWKPIMPNFGKLNPLTGVMRLFSKQQVVEAFKASGLALVLGGIATLYLKSHIEDFNSMLGMAVPTALPHMGNIILNGLLLLILVLAVFAAVDAPLQRFMMAQRLRMSPAEAKQEHKETEGNGEIKAKLKSRMRAMANKRMLAAVPKADLVVMNPTHYAVALKYDENSMGAPRVVAKGADLMAMRIRDAANGAEVPVLQAPVLARALYAHSEVDGEVPAALFAAVAQVLAYVYQLRAALAGQGKAPAALPTLNVPSELDPHNDPKFMAQRMSQRMSQESTAE
jgi:flagellar biosynthesis protein FlhB